MTSRHVLEPIQPEPGSFDARMMARGEPGVPRRFTWRGRTYEVAEVERSWREWSAPPAPAGDRYVRRHGYAIKTTDGLRLRLVAERGRGSRAGRWWVREAPDKT